MQTIAPDPRPQSMSRRSHSMSAPQRPSQFMIFSNTTPHKHPSPFRRITARVRAHFDSSTESDITRRPRSHTQPSQYPRQRVLSEGQSSPNEQLQESAATIARGFRRAAGSYPHARDRVVPSHRQQPYEAGPHDLWMGARVSPRLGLRTPLPLAAMGRRRPPTIPKPALPQAPKAQRSLTHTNSSESVSDDVQTTTAHLGHTVSATSSFVMLDSNDPVLGATPTSLAHPASQLASRPYTGLAKRTMTGAEAAGEWVMRNGKRHLRCQFTRGVKQERRERKEANGGAIAPRGIPYPVDYSPETLANHALGHLLHSVPGAPSVAPEQQAPQNCLDLGCGGGEWIRSALRRWPTCEFVGMDIVLLNRAQQVAGARKRNDQAGSVSPAKESRVSWITGNFLAERLPFACASFDYVHLRDLARAVPYHAWASLLSEIGRVLRPGGAVDITADDIVFPILPRSLTARPTLTEVIAYREGVTGRSRDPSYEEDTKPSGTTRFSDASRGKSDETVRHQLSGQTIQGSRSAYQPPRTYSNVGEWGSLPRDRTSEGMTRRGGSTTPSETILRPRGISMSKPRSRSRDILRGTFSDGDGVRTGLGRILRGSRRSAATSPSRGPGSGTDTEPRKSSVQPFFIPCVSASNLGSSPVLSNPHEATVCDPALEPTVRVSLDGPRVPTTSHASLGLGVPSFGFAMSSAALGSALSLRSMDGSIVNAPTGATSALSLHPPLVCSNLNLAHSSVVSFQGPLSPPLTPPRRELLVPDVNASMAESEISLVPSRDELSQSGIDGQVRPPLGHDYELLEELFYAVYARRDVHTQLTVALPGLVQASGVFETAQTSEPVVVNMPCYPGVDSRREETHTPPTPETSPKIGNIVCRERDVMTNKAAVHLKLALQGILGVQEAMWEELVLRRDLGDSPDERVRHERMQFEDMIQSYASAIRTLIDVPSKLVTGVQWRRPVPREQALEQKWIASESQKLRDAWAVREAPHGLTGYSTYSRRARTIIAVKA